MTQTLEVEAPSEANDKLALVDLRNLMQHEPPSARYVFEPIIPRRVTTLLGGHGGMGKSVLALTLAAHAACGRQWGPFVAVQCRAVYVSLEDDADTVRYRLRRIIEAYSLPAASAIDALQIFDGSGVEATLAMEIADAGIHRLTQTAVMERVADACKGAGLIVVDNASDAYGGNENDRRQVRGFIRLLTSIARENDAGFLLLAHIDKSAARTGASGNSYSGSTAWHNSVRSRLALLSEDGCITLTHEKAQFSKAADSVRLAFADHGVLMPLDARASQRAAESLVAADADAVADAIRAALAAGRTIGANATGPASTWAALEPFPELPAELKTGAGKARVRAAAVRLEREGRIIRVSYRDAYRHPRERYELAQSAPVSALESARAFPPIPPTRTSARAEAALVPDGALVTTRAEPAQLAHPDPSADWLATADQDIKRKLEAFRVNGSNHD
jgi:RecA-family ATPase